MACTTKCTRVLSVDGSNLPFCFEHDLCTAEEVLRNPALLVQWCLSKEFYNSVGTVDSSCVNCRRGSNYLQQSVLAFDQLFSSSLGGMQHTAGCACRCASDLPLRLRCPPAYFTGVGFMPTPGGGGFALTHAPAHHLENGIFVYLSIMHNILPMHS